MVCLFGIHVNESDSGGYRVINWIVRFLIEQLLDQLSWVSIESGLDISVEYRVTY